MGLPIMGLPAPPQRDGSPAQVTISALTHCSEHTKGAWNMHFYTRPLAHAAARSLLQKQSDLHVIRMTNSFLGLCTFSRAQCGWCIACRHRLSRGLSTLHPNGPGGSRSVPDPKASPQNRLAHDDLSPVPKLLAKLHLWAQRKRKLTSCSYPHQPVNTGLRSRLLGC